MTLIRCPSCGKSNRVGPVPRGWPRCGHCQAALPWVVEAGDDEFEHEAASSVPIVVDLWAPWCGPCRMVAPVLQRLADRNAGRLKLIKVNVDGAPRVAQRFGVRSIPTIVLLRAGREVDRLVGAPPSDQLEAWVVGHLPSEAT